MAKEKIEMELGLDTKPAKSAGEKFFKGMSQQAKKLEQNRAAAAAAPAGTPREGAPGRDAKPPGRIAGAAKTGAGFLSAIAIGAILSKTIAPFLAEITEKLTSIEQSASKQTESEIVGVLGGLAKAGAVIPQPQLEIMFQNVKESNIRLVQFQKRVHEIQLKTNQSLEGLFGRYTARGMDFLRDLL